MIKEGDCKMKEKEGVQGRGRRKKVCKKRKKEGRFKTSKKEGSARRAREKQAQDDKQ